MTRLKTILFDLDDTLYPTSDFARRARRSAVLAMIEAGLELPEGRVADELEEVIAEFSSNYEHHFDKLLLRLPADALSHQNRALIVAAGVAAYHDTKFEELHPYPGVLELLGDIRKADLGLGVITHGWSVKQAEKLVRLGVVPYLDPEAIFISDAIGISKPNPKLYLAALERLGQPAESVMYVGDNPANDIVPPHSIGMITVWARFGSRHATSPVPPDHEIDSFEDLRGLLRETYDVPLSPAAPAGPELR